MSTARPFHFSRIFILAGATTLLAFGLAACKSNPTQAPIVNNAAAANAGGADPADANMANYSSSGQNTHVMGQSQAYTPQQQGESYPSGQQAPAPIVQGQGYVDPQAYAGQGYPTQGNSGQGNYAQGYTDGEAAEAATAPPPLPEYDQPPAPNPNDIWTPGYWNYGPGGYYWVPGTWVAAPYYGALWTPPYWGWYGGHYRFHHGYWGQHVGYYGGINYGFGYIGFGYFGGYWHGHDFYYNRAMNRVGPSFGNVYERPVIVNNVRYDIHPTVRISYNGGPGGINAQPRPFEVAAEHEQHQGPVPAQVAMRQQAANDRGNAFAANGGRPAQAAFAHPPNAPTALPANTPGFNRPGEANRPGDANRPGAPAAGFNRPGEPEGTVNRPGAPAAGFNRPGEPVGTANHPGAPATGFNRPGEPNGAMPRPGTPNGQPMINRPGEIAGHNNAPPVQAGNRVGVPASQVGHVPPAEPENRSGGFNAPANRPAQPAQQPRGNQPTGNGGFERSSPAVVNRQGQPQHTGPAEAPRAVQAPAPRVETPRQAPAPRVEAPRQAPAPRVEAPAQHVEVPRAAPAPRAEAPRAPAAGGEGHPGGGGHAGPRK